MVLRGRLIFAVTLLVGKIALAGPPFVTDDPEPVDLHHWEVYLASQMQYVPAQTDGTLPHVEVNYGVVHNLQLHIIAPIAFARPTGGPTLSGFGDTELGIKYRLVQELPRRPMIGIFPLVELPTGDSKRGLGSGEYQFFIPIWLQKSWGSWTSYGGGGYVINPGIGNRDYWLFGWLMQKDLSQRLTLGGEFFGTTAQTEVSNAEYDINFGGQINLNEHQHILFSAGHNLKGTSNWMSYLALQWTFGR
jgi:hypothetical protein